MSKVTREYWNSVWRQLGYHFESQVVESFPFTDLLRMVAKKSDLNEAKVYAYVSGFELRMKKILPDIKKTEKQAFERASKSLLVLTDSIMGNVD
ncbi:MAG: hypothetical protein J7576_08465 [Siphonobacter aquaeclarae]|nr:hypothetical protein [Siphonobacter aquaeclarae]